MTDGPAAPGARIAGDGVVLGSCDDCVFYRKGTSTADQLVRLVPPYARTAAAGELQELRKSDQEQRSTEEAAAALTHPAERHGHRPTGFRYCGEREVESVWEDVRYKNANHTCTSRRTKQDKPDAGTRTCATCRHRVAPDFDAYDHLSALLGRFSSVGDSSPLGQRTAELWSDVRSACEAGAKWELRTTYDHTGTVTARPAQLPWCQALSDEDTTRYVVGEVVNVGGTCSRWEAGTASTETATAELWQQVQRAHVALESEREHRKQENLSYLQLHSDVLDQLRYEHDQLAVEYLGTALRRLGLTATEADQLATELQAMLLSAHPKPWRRGGMPVAARAAEAPDPGIPSGRAAPRRGGLLDAVLGLTGLLPATPASPEPEETSAGPPPAAPFPTRPSLRERMDPASDGAVLLTGLHVNPADPCVVAQLQQQDRGAVGASFGRTGQPGGKGGVLERHDLAVSVLPGPDQPTVDVRRNIGGYWSPQGFFPCGRWLDARLIFGGPFPARVGFLLASSPHTGVRLEGYVQWLDGPR